MNRDFVYNFENGPPSAWSRAVTIINRWLWGLLCCGIPGAPCIFCKCCEKRQREPERERVRVNQATATADRMTRPHRPNAPGRKTSPELLTAVRCALSQLQGEPAPPLPSTPSPVHVPVAVGGVQTCSEPG